MDRTIYVSHRCPKTPLSKLIKRNIEFEDGKTHLLTAVEENNMEETCMWLYFGADPHVVNKFGKTCFDIALMNYNFDLALILIDYFDEIDMRNTYEIYMGLLARYGRLAGTLFIFHPKSEDLLVKYFKLLSYKIIPKLIQTPNIRFLEDYLRGCDYSAGNWLKCLYFILDQPNATLLLQNFNKRYSSDNVHNMLYAFKEKKVLRRNRIAMTWAWLGLGGRINIMSINVALHLFGFNEEVEALIYAAGAVRVCCLRILPLTVFVLALEENFSTVILFENFLGFWADRGIPEFISFARKEIKFDAVKVVVDTLRFFTIPIRVRKMLLIQFKYTVLYCREIVDVIKKLPKVPKLVELSRDETRIWIKTVFKVTKPYEFHEAVKNLDAPQEIKDIIIFKRSLYDL